MTTVILPAYNEAPAVGPIVAAVRELLADEGSRLQIMVVDDGSDDGTGEAARAAGARVLSHPHNVGYGKALKNGILAATDDTIVICDADGSYPPQQIPELLSEYSRGFDMVVGARRSYRDSLFKAPLRLVLKWLVQYTVGRRVPDVNSGLRVFSRATVLPYLPTLSDSFSFTTSLTLAYMMSHRFVAYVPIEYRHRRGTSKVRLVRDSLRTLQYIVQAVLYYNPLKLFILGSVGCVVVAALGVVLTRVLGLGGGPLIGVGGLLLAVVVFCIGLVADLLKQILDRQRGDGTDPPRS